MFAHILLPTDGSSLSEAAIRNGITLAKKIGAKVTGLCVVPSQNQLYLMEITEPLKKEIAGRLRSEADQILEVVAGLSAAAGVPCETLCEINLHPHEAIIAVSEKRGCDLIMMASHGKGGIAGLLLGSETQKVLTHSRVPVLVLR